MSSWRERLDAHRELESASGRDHAARVYGDALAHVSIEPGARPESVVYRITVRRAGVFLYSRRYPDALEAARFWRRMTY